MPLEPGLEPHFCIIFSVLEDGPRNYWVYMIYGDSVKNSSRDLDCFYIDESREDLPALNQAGLSRATKFNMTLAMWLPYDQNFFTCKHPHQSPVTGSIRDDSDLQKAPKDRGMHPLLRQRLLATARLTGFLARLKESKAEVEKRLS